MNLEDAVKLRKAWGDKPCDHPELVDEILFGSKTGDYICVQCGMSISQRKKDKLCRTTGNNNPQLEQYRQQAIELKERLALLDTKQGLMGKLKQTSPEMPVLEKFLEVQKELCYLSGDLAQVLDGE